MKKLYLLLITVLLLSSCSTNLVYMSVQEPAPVTLPSDIQSVGIIDRSLPSGKTQVADKIDQILTLEGNNLDKEGAKSTITGLQDELIKNKRFNEIKTFTRDDLRTTGSGVFPAALDWSIIENICNENNVNALFSLEMFDTDTRVSLKMNQVTVSTPLGNVPGIEHEAALQTQIKTGWRIYYPKDHSIVDEYALSETITLAGKGINPVNAIAAISGRKDAVKNAGMGIGQTYALRIVPYWIRVSRDYYIKGTDNLKTAMRRARTGNWDGAAELWLKETTNEKAKVAGRACYNMAIINEINGDLNKAVEWAQKAYSDYNNKLALDYVNILKYRQSKNSVLEMQK